MIDIHCHILPGVDDGPLNLFESLEMARSAAYAGITNLFATPHHLNGRYDNPKESILKDVLELNQLIKRENVPLTVHTGQELRIHRELFITLKTDEVLTLDNKGKYLLLELPSGEVPSYSNDIVYELVLKGIIPIIVHPERNKRFLEDHNLLFDLVKEGALTQLTAGSIIGEFGKKVKSFSDKIIENHLAHFIATDAHNTELRGFLLKEAYETISRTFGIHYTCYFQKNAELLLNGGRLSKEQPLPFKKKIFGIF